MDGLKIIGAAVAGYALVTAVILALTRRNADGGNVKRRCGRPYIVVRPQDDAPRNAETFDWRKPGNAPEGKDGADSAGKKEG